MSDSSTLAAEVGGSLSLAGLMLVFLPFFVAEVRETGERMSARQLRWSRRLIWLSGALVLLPLAASIVGLLTLWGTADLAEWTAGLTAATIAAVASGTVVTVWLVTVGWR